MEWVLYSSETRIPSVKSSPLMAKVNFESVLASLNGVRITADLEEGFLSKDRISSGKLKFFGRAILIELKSRIVRDKGFVIFDKENRL